jgi:hypothetical protein
LRPAGAGGMINDTMPDTQAFASPLVVGAAQPGVAS